MFNILYSRRDKVSKDEWITYVSMMLPPYWQDKDVTGSVDVGLGFKIDVKVSVNGSAQYKVHNSKGKTYYITANEALVYVK